MTKAFAEQILDNMVDENGHCGERGLSEKQFKALRPYLEETEAEYCGGWTGSNGGGIRFCEWDAQGVIGKYNVALHVYSHFHNQYTVKSIDKWIDEVPSFENSEFQFEPKKRIDMELTLIRKVEWEQQSYSGYGYDTIRLYTFADDNGNCYIWKTSGYVMVEEEDEDGYIEETFAHAGDKVKMRATVKEHNEYKGIKQTVLTRCKVSEITSR